MLSWIESANDSGCDFPIQNLPYGVFTDGTNVPRCATAIGDRILDLAVMEEAELLSAGGRERVFNQASLNAFMKLGPTAWARVRDQLTEFLMEAGDRRLRDDRALCERAFAGAGDISLHMPFEVSEYTDFYANKQHAINVGSMFRDPQNALPPNWLHIPIGYNGRASTVVVSGTDIRRPLGQMKSADAPVPVFGPCRHLDIELEMGAVIGTSSTMGEPITVAEADEMIFGYVILNDWSARDIQAWEYQPLGPFQAKAFATTISPWIVTKTALEPFRTSTPQREKDLLPYLNEPRPMLYDIDLEILMQPHGSDAPSVISRTNYNTMYYSAAQQLAHHAIGGCRMRTGDLLGSGTISGPQRNQSGSLLELTWGGKEPLTLETGVRRFIEDGDVLTLRGRAQGEGYRIGFGECTGKVLPAPNEKNR